MNEERVRERENEWGESERKRKVTRKKERGREGTKSDRERKRPKN